MSIDNFLEETQEETVGIKNDNETLLKELGDQDPVMAIVMKSLFDQQAIVVDMSQRIETLENYILFIVKKFEAHGLIDELKDETQK